ncbi:uncharacterized protein LOC129727118 [Wyeomyia smithii]|uniref:uncharacterized protein LOC129727118 n=1 Tax=Wyeomyia smithii TaxID=174621 RepID=UPI0024680DC0|nr:uncharacterized protein LOC129727118 [Wyeomyia smithii]
MLTFKFPIVVLLTAVCTSALGATERNLDTFSNSRSSFVQRLRRQATTEAAPLSTVAPTADTTTATNAPESEQFPLPPPEQKDLSITKEFPYPAAGSIPEPPVPTKAGNRFDAQRSGRLGDGGFQSDRNAEQFLSSVPHKFPLPLLPIFPELETPMRLKRLLDDDLEGWPFAYTSGIQDSIPVAKASTTTLSEADSPNSAVTIVVAANEKGNILNNTKAPASILIKILT